MMKKVITVLFLTVFVLSAFSLSYDDNEYQQKSRAYTALANKSYDEGDYDAAIEYAKLAAHYAQLSADFIQKMLARTEAEQEMNKARTRLRWAKSNNADKNYPEAYAAAQDAINSGGTAFDNGSYDVATVFAQKALKSLSNVKAQAKKTEPPKKPVTPAKPKPEPKKPVTPAKPKPEPKKPAPAKPAPAKPKPAPAKPEPKKPEPAKPPVQEEPKQPEPPAPEPVPEPEPAPAEPDKVVLAELPAEYRIRTWRGEKDCFWNIAANDAIYGNPYMWRKLYEANKHKLPDPNNPNWVEPDIILVIPSLKGEKRSGRYDPATVYKSLP